MHTTRTGGKYIYFHNSDFSGEVVVSEDGNDLARIPFEDMKTLVADWVRGRLQERIDGASDDNILIKTP